MLAHERWSEHTRHLPPLIVSNNVRIQNQIGHHPNKWDKTGTVIEVHQFDQHVIRLYGSRRVTGNSSTSTYSSPSTYWQEHYLMTGSFFSLLPPQLRHQPPAHLVIPIMRHRPTIPPCPSCLHFITSSTITLPGPSLYNNAVNTCSNCQNTTAPSHAGTFTSIQCHWPQGIPTIFWAFPWCH